MTKRLKFYSTIVTVTFTYTTVTSALLNVHAQVLVADDCDMGWSSPKCRPSKTIVKVDKVSEEPSCHVSRTGMSRIELEFRYVIPGKSASKCQVDTFSGACHRLNAPKGL